MVRSAGQQSKAAPNRRYGERLAARVTAEQKALIEYAAALQRRSVAEFVLASVLDAARQTIRNDQVLTITARDSRAFVQALLDPPPVNDRLRTTVRRYRASMARSGPVGSAGWRSGWVGVEDSCG